MPKDLFSAQANLYAQFRPGYPKALYDHILSFVPQKGKAWDCATGNGQAAGELANYFTAVYATDISPSQLDEAIKRDNIFYSIASAEYTHFENDTFDLITIATAYHWINWELFKKEAFRVGKNECVVAAWTYYTLLTDDKNIQQVYNHFYKNITNPYWEKERQFVDDQYKTVAFDFEPLPDAHFETVVHWTKEQFKGYLGTWSAVQNYKKLKGHDPLLLIREDLDNYWSGTETKEFRFPLALLLGKVVK